MPKRIKHQRLPTDINQVAHRLGDVSTSGDRDSIQLPTKAQVSMLMAELGRKGGRIGGKRRLHTMTQKERTQIARKAAETRWGKEHNNE